LHQFISIDAENIRLYLGSTLLDDVSTVYKQGIYNDA